MPPREPSDPSAAYARVQADFRGGVTGYLEGRARRREQRDKLDQLITAAREQAQLNQAAQDQEAAHRRQEAQLQSGFRREESALEQARGGRQRVQELLLQGRLRREETAADPEVEKR